MLFFLEYQSKTPQCRNSFDYSFYSSFYFTLRFSYINISLVFKSFKIVSYEHLNLALRIVQRLVE